MPEMLQEMLRKKDRIHDKCKKEYRKRDKHGLPVLLPQLFQLSLCRQEDGWDKSFRLQGTESFELKLQCWFPDMNILEPNFVVML